MSFCVWIIRLVRGLPPLPYIEAIQREVHRRQSLAPLSILRRCTEDTTLGGYFIPKKKRVKHRLDCGSMTRATPGLNTENLPGTLRSTTVEPWRCSLSSPSLPASNTAPNMCHRCLNSATSKDEVCPEVLALVKASAETEQAFEYERDRSWQQRIQNGGRKVTHFGPHLHSLDSPHTY
uniref:Uncharacterized protein n=1 Tax=Timema bartmani TaxID=61472 RepID=A0A7R9EP85_9NEOP|nr:unnamed protein product [Timema bartmani]